MSESTTPTVKSLEERGYYFLLSGEFKKAQEYFNRALDADITRSESHMGLLLCEYQCKDISELVIDYSLCFEDSINFRGALRYADEKKTRLYNNYLQISSVACAGKVLEAFAVRDFLVMEKRIAAYGRFSCADRRIRHIQDFLTAYADDQYITGQMLTLCLYLYEVYSSLGFKIEAEAQVLNDAIMYAVRNSLTECYTFYAGIYLDLILGAKDNEDMSDAVCKFSDPKSTDTRGYDFACSTSEGLDGRGDSPCERFIFLARSLFEKHKKLNAKKVEDILLCYGNAEKCAKDEQEKEKATESKRDFAIKAAAYEKIRDNADGEKIISALIQANPDEAELYFDFILYRTKKLTVMPAEFAESDSCKDYLSRPFKKFDKAQLDLVFDELNFYKNEIEAVYEDCYGGLSDYAEKAVSLDKSGKKEEYASKWKAYEQSFTAAYGSNHAAVCAKLEEVTAKKHDDKSKGESHTAKKSSMQIIFTVILSLLSAFAPLAVAAVTFLKPKMLLDYPSVALFGGAFGIGALIGIIGRIITGSVSKKPAGVFERKKLHSALLKAAPHLHSVFVLAALGLLVYSFIAFPSALGTVKIKNAKQLDYLLNCPTANFVLTEDITLKKNQKITLQFFGGRLDGKGHTVSGMKQDGYFIATNTGTVKNIEFKDYSGKGLCKDNSGEIYDLTFESAEFTSSVVEKNTKTVKDMEFNNCRFAFARETKLNQAFVYSGTGQEQQKTFKTRGCQLSNVPMYVNVQEGLNIRQEPWIYSYSYGVMPYNTRVILKKIGDGWNYVSWNDTEGWCASEYLSYEQ